jgi:hypothetical protein
MPLIIAIFIGVMFLGCGPGQIEEISQKSISQSKSQIQPTMRRVQEVIGEEIVGLDIDGNYTLKEGRYLYSANSSINKNLISSDLVIEKLDSDDYGYYFTMKIEGLSSPIWEYGIIHKDGEKYFKRIIYSTNITEESNISIDSNISNEHLKTEITDEIKITQKVNSIQIDMKSKDGKVKIIWDKDPVGYKKPMTPELRNARHDYIITYRDRFNRLFKED